MTKTVLLIWLAFDALVFLLCWLDYIWYRHDLPRVYRKIMDAFMEDVDED